VRRRTGCKPESFALQIVAKANGEGTYTYTYLYTSLFVSTYTIYTLSSFLLFLFLFLFFFCSSSSFAAIDLARDDSSAGATAAGQVISEHLPLLHQMLQTLLQAGRGREGEAMAHILAFVGGLLPPALQQGISRAALEACQNADAQVSTKDLLLHTSFAGCGVAHVLNTSLAPVIMNALPCALLTGMHPCFHAITN